MRIYHAESVPAKGWTTGPWDSDLDISIGYANEGVNEPHYHQRMTEIYFIASGTATMQVEGLAVDLKAKDVVVIEPGEAHTFCASTPDHYHFVIQTPGLIGEDAKKDKVLVDHMPVDNQTSHGNE